MNDRYQALLLHNFGIHKFLVTELKVLATQIRVKAEGFKTIANRALQGIHRSIIDMERLAIPNLNAHNTCDG